jgi:hypothetical protein
MDAKESQPVIKKEKRTCITCWRSYREEACPVCGGKERTKAEVFFFRYTYVQGIALLIEAAMAFFAILSLLNFRKGFFAAFLTALVLAMASVGFFQVHKKAVKSSLFLLLGAALLAAALVSASLSKGEGLQAVFYIILLLANLLPAVLFPFYRKILKPGSVDNKNTV